MNLPNALTISRIFLVPLLLTVLLTKNVPHKDAIAVAIVFLTTTSANPTPQTTAVDSRGDRVGWVVVGRNPCTGKHTPFCRAARNYDLAHRSHGAVP